VKYYGFVTFFLVGWLVGYTVFFSGTPQGRTRGRIFTVYGSYDVFLPKAGPFGGCDNIGIHLGVIPPKLPQKGRELAIQAKPAEYKNGDILHNINTINVQL